MFTCDWCGKPLSKKRQYDVSRLTTQNSTCCCREHSVLLRQQVGDFKRIASLRGENWKRKLVESNRKVPRRRKHEQDGKS